MIREVELAGLNSRKDKFVIRGLAYIAGETVDAPLNHECSISIEYKILEMVECMWLTNVIGKVTRRAVEEEFIDKENI